MAKFIIIGIIIALIIFIVMVVLTTIAICKVLPDLGARVIPGYCFESIDIESTEYDEIS